MAQLQYGEANQRVEGPGAFHHLERPADHEDEGDDVGDPYDPLQLQKYEDKGVRYVFILINDHSHLLSELNNSLLSNLKSAFKAGGDISKSAEITAFDLVMDAAVEIGVSKETAKTMKLVVSKSIESAKQNADLSHLLTLMMNGGSFKSEHSLTLSYVTGQICMAMGNQYEEALESLAVASLMHDSALEDDQLCKIHDSPDFNLWFSLQTTRLNSFFNS